MTHVGCPCCQLRLTSAMAAQLLACPECGRSLRVIGTAESAVGFSLFVPQDALNPLPEAIAVSVPLPDPARGTI